MGYYTASDQEAGATSSAMTCPAFETDESESLATESSGSPENPVPKGPGHADPWSPQACLEQIWSGRLSSAQKLVFVAPVLLPKLVVALMLSHVGGVYIFLSRTD